MYHGLSPNVPEDSLTDPTVEWKEFQSSGCATQRKAESRRREQSEAGQHYTPLDHRRDVLGGEEAASISDLPSILSSGLSVEQEAPAHGNVRTTAQRGERRGPGEDSE